MAARIGATRPVVLDHDPKGPIAIVRPDPDAGRVAGILRDVGQRLGHDVVDRREGGGRSVAGQPEVDLCRHRRAVGRRPDRRPEARFGQDRRMDPSSELPDVVEDLEQLDTTATEGRVEIGSVAVDGPELHREGHHPLLEAVVEVALDPAPLGVGGLDDPRARRPDLGQLFLDLLDDEQLAAQFRTANTIVQYRYRNPESQITVKLLEAEEGQVDLGPTRLEPEVVMTMDADTAHRFWLGKVNVTIALARGQIKAKGPVAKILKLVPLVKPVFPRYKAQLEAAGRSDLAGV